MTEINFTADIDIDYEEVAQYIDASTIAECFSHYDLARELDLSDLASEISTYDIAQEFDAESIAEYIDMDDVVDTVLSQVKAQSSGLDVPTTVDGLTDLANDHTVAIETLERRVDELTDVVSHLLRVIQGNGEASVACAEELQEQLAGPVVAAPLPSLEVSFITDL